MNDKKWFLDSPRSQPNYLLLNICLKFIAKLFGDPFYEILRGRAFMIHVMKLL